MAFVFGFFALGTAYAAVKWSRDSFDRWFFCGCCLLNLAALAFAISSEGAGAFNLRPALSANPF